jgi:hypothetical protein
VLFYRKEFPIQYARSELGPLFSDATGFKHRNALLYGMADTPVNWPVGAEMLKQGNMTDYLSSISPNYDVSFDWGPSTQQDIVNDVSHAPRERQAPCECVDASLS